METYQHAGRLDRSAGRVAALYGWSREDRRLMRILITNDDGIHAPGLAVVERIARGPFATTSGSWRQRPTRAALPHSLSLNEPLRLRRSTTERFALRGTPTDCVIMAVRRRARRQPDLVIVRRQLGPERCRRRDLFGNRGGRDRGHAARHPFDRPQPSLRSQLGGEAASVGDGRAFRPTSSAARRLRLRGRRASSTSTFPTCRRTAVAGVEITSQGRLLEHRHTISRSASDGRGNPYFWLTYKRAGSHEAASRQRPLRAGGAPHLDHAAPRRHDQPRPPATD